MTEQLKKIEELLAKVAEAKAALAAEVDHRMELVAAVDREVGPAIDRARAATRAADQAVRDYIRSAEAETVWPAGDDIRMEFKHGSIFRRLVKGKLIKPRDIVERIKRLAGVAPGLSTYLKIPPPVADWDKLNSAPSHVAEQLDLTRKPDKVEYGFVVAENAEGKG